MIGRGRQHSRHSCLFCFAAPSSSRGSGGTRPWQDDVRRHADQNGRPQHGSVHDQETSTRFHPISLRRAFTSWGILQRSEFVSGPPSPGLSFLHGPWYFAPGRGKPISPLEVVLFRIHLRHAGIENRLHHNRKHSHVFIGHALCSSIPVQRSVYTRVYCSIMCEIQIDRHSVSSDLSTAMVRRWCEDGNQG
ncbi:hypothetical protein J2129_002047 [Methanofollis sp. W23]|nr:hypothetical protein [Methanofollis sp. W23]